MTRPYGSIMRGFGLAVEEDLTLVVAEPRFAEPFAALVEANREHLARFDPWAVAFADVAAARAMLTVAVTRFADKTEVPTLVVTGGEIAGIVSLRVDVPARSGALGYWLGAAHTGRGLATRAVRALSAFGFDELGLVRVSAQLDIDNSASRAVVRRAGFTREGVLRSGALAHGVVGDLEQWSLLPGEAEQSAYRGVSTRNS